MSVSGYKFPVKKDADFKSVAMSNRPFKNFKSFTQGIGNFNK